MNKTRNHPRIVDDDGEELAVSQWSYKHFIGPLDYNLNILHTCDRLGCWNPQHLYQGAQDRNMLDMLTRGRYNGWNYNRSGENNPRARITNEQAKEIRLRMKRGGKVAFIARKMKLPYYIVWYVASNRTYTEI